MLMFSHIVGIKEYGLDEICVDLYPLKLSLLFTLEMAILSLLARFQWSSCFEILMYIKVIDMLPFSLSNVLMDWNLISVELKGNLLLARLLILNHLT